MPLSVAPPIFTMGSSNHASPYEPQANEKDVTIVLEESIGSSSARVVADAGKVKVCCLDGDRVRKRCLYFDSASSTSYPCSLSLLCSC